MILGAPHRARYSVTAIATTTSRPLAGGRVGPFDARRAARVTAGTRDRSDQSVRRADRAKARSAVRRLVRCVAYSSATERLLADDFNFGAKDVARPPLRPYDRRLCADRFDLLPEPADLCIDGAVVDLVVVHP